MLDVKFKKRILFVGIPDMAYICLDGLLSSGVNIVGVMGPKKSHSTYFQFKKFVEDRNLNFIEWNNLKDENFINYIKSLNIDVAVVASFNYKIPKELLEATKNGFINIHPSLLPDYRGGNPYSSVIIDGQTETGVTIHFMDEDFDTGDIITQKKVEIAYCETMGTLFNRLNLLGMQMLLNILKDFEKGDLQRFKQPKGDFLKGKSLKDKDLFIDYGKSAEYIERFVRALNPFLIASTTFRGNMLKVFMAECIEDKNTSQYPKGSIVKIEDGKIHIATGNGFICPTVLQFGSFFVGDTRDFIKILAPKIGEVFK